MDDISFSYVINLLHTGRNVIKLRRLDGCFRKSKFYVLEQSLIC